MLVRIKALDQSALCSFCFSGTRLADTNNWYMEVL